MNDALHPLNENHSQPKMGSERNFGLVFAAVFVILALLPLLHSNKVHWWLLPIAFVFLALAVVAPRMLAPLNRLWFLIGILLGKVVTPLVMSILWFVVVTPVGFLMRLFGNDPLRLKREFTDKSYWITRSPPGPVAGFFQESILGVRFEMSFFKEFLQFIGARKKYWLLPVLLMMVVFGGLVILTQGSAIAPFIYTLF